MGGPTSGDGRSGRSESNSSVSTRGFLIGLAVPATVAALQQMFFDEVFMGHALFVAVVFCGAAVAVMHSSYQGRKIQTAIRAALLGDGFAMGVILATSAPTSWQPFGWYMMVLCGFHFSEYLCTALTNPRAVSDDSFLLNHSVAYAAAAVSSWLEFWLERALFPDMKECSFTIGLGLLLCISGEVIRKLAMFTARTNFNHIVQNERRPDHVLVTHGVYSWFRHPSYVGWFWWSVGTQLLLTNPVCLVGYTAASWTFFRDRVHYEEATLINFFGHAYLAYQQRVGTGLPGIAGFKLSRER
ncbi:protein-S-isoprenylcysteine O-methyltransferase-like [Pollicipes pollicipes]|uniref:protein-S-isoprenylcysteine O-methyltransferase-like n=1 Tax=Pollicipes pollicipes TaxID=41117 RepID=UPI001884AEEF|nr:protein-S-isoprenylcysteine O-methyltransferase-like [Pollicipes pollicipes]XP_037075542.1 protein-S-isoprenylcysteine O-methyltransferase-like [Pollicipes pollicipes]